MVAAPELSVVVLTHNSFRDKSGCIRHTLTALRHQTERSFEVVVVDNGSEHVDQRQLATFLGEHPFCSVDLVTTHTNLPLGVARNLGVNATRAEIVVLLDDDAILLDTKALATVKRVAAGSSHGYGAQRLWTPAHPWFACHHVRIAAALQTGDFRPLIQSLGRPPFEVPEHCLAFDHSFPGHFGFFRRKLFDAVGGLPTDFVGYGYEDNAFALLCYLQSRQFGWLGELRVAHVDHPRPARYEVEHRINETRYKKLLAERALCAFNIDLLLGGYTDSPQDQILIAP